MARWTKTSERSTTWEATPHLTDLDWFKDQFLKSGWFKGDIDWTDVAKAVTSYTERDNAQDEDFYWFYNYWFDTYWFFAFTEWEETSDRSTTWTDDGDSAVVAEWDKFALTDLDDHLVCDFDATTDYWYSNRWHDRSTNAYQMGNTPPYLPDFVSTGGPNNLGYIWFHTEKDNIGIIQPTETIVSIPVVIPQPFTILFVVQFDAAQNHQRIFNTEFIGPMITWYTATKLRINFGTNWDCGTYPSDSAWHLFLLVVNGTNSKFYIDNDAALNGDPGSSGLPGLLRISRYGGIFGGTLQGKVNRFILWNTALDAGQCTKLIAKLNETVKLW